MTSQSVQAPPRMGALRTGVVLAALLAIGDGVGGATNIDANNPVGTAVSVLMLLLAVTTLVAVPFAWRGMAAGRWTIAITRVVGSLTGLPAFFVAGLPPQAIIAASVGIVLALVVAALLLVSRPSK